MMKTRILVNIRHNLCIAGVIFPLLLASTVAAAAKEVYRWVDEAGVVHFTHEPPSSIEYQTVRPNTAMVGTVAPGNPEAPINVSSAQQSVESSSAAAATESLELSDEERVRLCQRAGENIVQLEPVKRILVDDGAGGTRQLDDSERLEMLAGSRSFIAENCN